MLFSRHADPAESEPARVTEQDLRAMIERPFTFVPDLAIAAESSGDAARVKAWWWLFLIILVGVLALENTLALLFGHYQPHAESAPEVSQ